jgi:DNA-binding winged helix-turn-helix (wHTH) protein/predicted ATPase
MESPSLFFFPPFRIDIANERLWLDSQEIPLRPKTFAVLRYLIEHVAQLVTKGQLLDALWPGSYVTDSALKSCVRELRRALRDEVKAPRFIETAHRRGYRFIAPLSATPPVISCQLSVVSKQSPTTSPQLATGNWQLPTPLVGREAELTQLHQWLEKTLKGARRIVFVTGEAGIGKTALVETFLQEVAAGERLWIGRGQCIEHYGAGEPYMPVLEAFGRLCREPGGQRLVEVLSHHAPTWLMQMPALLTTADAEALQHKVNGATRERMLREMAEAIETLTAEKPLVLALQDLHWSDSSTLELLAFLARRWGSDRLLVIGTYRPAEASRGAHPLKATRRELHLQRSCEELPLKFLSAAAVTDYVSARFAGATSDSLCKLASVIYRRTDGNPFFMVNVVDHLLQQGLVAQNSGRWELKGDLPGLEKEMPESLRQILETRIDALSPQEQRLLEIGSVVGREFSTATVAAVLGETLDEVEEWCEELARRDRFLQSAEIRERPDSASAACYKFIHALYQEVLYSRMTLRRRTRLHQQIGEREEREYGERTGDIAAELAMHFERGRNYERAVRYHHLAGENALRRSAHQEAITHLRKGLELLGTLPDTPERARQELLLQIALGIPQQAVSGYASPEVEQTYVQALELYRQVGETARRFPILGSLTTVYQLRGHLQKAHALGEQLLTLAENAGNPTLLLWAHMLHGCTFYNLGELTTARMHLEHGMALYDPQQHNPRGSGGRNDPGVACLSTLTSILWLLGYPDQALKSAEMTLTLAQDISDPFSQAFAFASVAVLHQRRREAETTRHWAETLVTLSAEHRFPFRGAAGMIYRGWALAEQGQGAEGGAQIRQGLAAVAATGAELARPYYLALLAEAQDKAGQVEKGLLTLAEALTIATKNDDRFYEAELYRLKGQLTLQKLLVASSQLSVINPQSPTPNLQTEAEGYFHKAIEIAQRQQAKSLELRAVTSLSRLWQAQGKTAAARQQLAPVYHWFTEGFDTADLQETKALLEELQ